MAPILRSAPSPESAAAELPWRVLALMNIFRLIAPMVLLLVFFFDAPTRSVGAHDPGLFIGICAAYFSFGLISMQPIQRRWPSVQWLALFQVVVDTVAIILLIHASGGVTSGLGTLLILPAGATATIVAPRLALLVTSLIAIALLFQTAVASLAGIGSSADFLVAGLTGASLFAITLVAMPLANRLRESEALVKQRDIDLANLNELNEFIVQHLRESILVVDTEDRIRLINGTAARLLKDGPVEAGELLGEVSPRLIYLLETWRRQVSDRRDSTGEVVSADGGTVIRPHFVPLSETGPGPVLVFLEDTSAVAERVQQSKLASLGRLSASIAHEIRNPVGAMSHAGPAAARIAGAWRGRSASHGHHREERGPGEPDHRERAAVVATRDDAAGADRPQAVAREFRAGVRRDPAGGPGIVPAAAGRRRSARCSSIRPTCTRSSGTCATTP